MEVEGKGILRKGKAIQWAKEVIIHQILVDIVDQRLARMQLLIIILTKTRTSLRLTTII